MIQRGGKIQGSHPIHGSTTGCNFLIDTSKNQWVCFHGGHNPPHGGGGVWSAIAVMEGLIDCSESSSMLSDDIRKEVARIAREKYGYKPKEQEINFDDREPVGWAKSISILKMAQRYNLTNCPKCNSEFKFVDKLGWFNCPNKCFKGGLKKFSLLCARKKMERIEK